MSKLRLLIKPTIFVAGTCTLCGSAAMVCQYETNRPKRHMFHVPWPPSRREANWTDKLRSYEKIAYGAILVNAAVFSCWKVKSLRPFMKKYFLSDISDKKIRLAPMILANFSHISALHLTFNMCALYSFTNYATNLLGPEQLVALYISTGAISSLMSVACRLIINRVTPSLGASGAILGVVGYICVKEPDSRLMLLFIPMSAGLAIKCIIGIDTVGLLARWAYIDHAAHLGGSLSGVIYALYGERAFYKYRNQVVNRWINIKKAIN